MAISRDCLVKSRPGGSNTRSGRLVSGKPFSLQNQAQVKVVDFGFPRGALEGKWEALCH